MPYVHRTRWGRMVEIGGNSGVGATLNTVPANYAVGQIATPTASTLDNPQVKGAFLDLQIGRYVNSAAGANYILADADLPYIQLAPVGHTAFMVKSDLTGAANCNVAGTFSGYRLYGDNNFASVFRWGHDHNVNLWNCRCFANNLSVYDCHPIIRLYLI